MNFYTKEIARGLLVGLEKISLFLYIRNPYGSRAS